MGEYSISTILTYVGVILLTFGLMNVNYGSFAVTCIRWLKPLKIVPGHPIKQPKMSSSEVAPCYVPALHLYKVNAAIGGPVLCNVLNFLGALFMIINLFNKFAFAINGVVMLVCSYLMLIGMFLYWLSYGIVTAYAAYTYGFGGLTIILCLLAPHLTCWYLRNNIPTRMRQVHKKRVFEEHSDDYVLREKKR